MSASDRKWNRTKLYAALLGSALAVGACSPAESDDPIINPGYTQDTGTAVVPEASVPGNDAGTTLPAQDSGTGVLPGNDSSVQPGLDSSVTPGADSSVPAADTGVVPDGSLGGDTSVGGDSSVGGDASVPDADVPDTAVPHMDQGKGNGTDVITIGDSWMSNTLGLIEGTGDGIVPSLKTVTKQNYRNYAVQGVMLLKADSFGPAIPTQWDAAVKANKNIKTVIMTGGGNDIIQGEAALQTSCKNGTQLCQDTLNQIGMTLGNLWNKMSEAGVQDIIYVLYAKAANEGKLKDPENNNAGLNLLCSKVKPPARCFTLNTDALVGATGGLAIDGIHPVKAANDRIAKAISDLMVKEGMRR